METPDSKKTINGKIKINFEYYCEEETQLENQENIGSHNAEGVLRINILNGTCK